MHKFCARCITHMSLIQDAVAFKGFSENKKGLTVDLLVTTVSYFVLSWSTLVRRNRETKHMFLKISKAD